MKKTLFIGAVLLLLAGCFGGNASTGTNSDSSASVAAVQTAPVAGALRDAVTAENMPWMEYADPALGIAFKHPGFVGDLSQPSCTQKMVPVTVMQNGDHLTLMQEYALTPDCASAASPTNIDQVMQGGAITGSSLNIWTQKVGYPEGFLSFAQQIYGTACRIDDSRVYQWKDPMWKQIYLTTDSQSTEDVKACNDSFVLYDDVTGTALTFFLPLKTAITFATPDQAGTFDAEIQDSFRFLPPNGQ